MIKKAAELFPLWVILFSCYAFFFPQTLATFKPAIVPLLGLVMFGMGVTLTADDFLRLLKRPRSIAPGILMQYLLMPLIAWVVAQGFGRKSLLLPDGF